MDDDMDTLAGQRAEAWAALDDAAADYKKAVVAKDEAADRLHHYIILVDSLHDRSDGIRTMIVKRSGRAIATVYRYLNQAQRPFQKNERRLP